MIGKVKVQRAQRRLHAAGLYDDRAVDGQAGVHTIHAMLSLALGKRSGRAGMRVALAINDLDFASSNELAGFVAWFAAMTGDPWAEGAFNGFEEDRTVQWCAGIWRARNGVRAAAKRGDVAHLAEALDCATLNAPVTMRRTVAINGEAVNVDRTYDRLDALLALFA